MNDTKTIPILHYKKQYIILKQEPFQLSIYYCKNKPEVTNENSVLINYINYKESLKELPTTKLDIQFTSAYCLFTNDYYMPQTDSVIVYDTKVYFNKSNAEIYNDNYMLSINNYIKEKAKQIIDEFKWKYLNVLLTGELKSYKGSAIIDYIQSKAYVQVKQILSDIINQYKQTIERIEKENN